WFTTKFPLLSLLYMYHPVVICLRSFMHWIDCARSFALLKAGNSIAAKIAMIAMTTKSSIKVNPRGGVAASVLVALGCKLFIDFPCFRWRPGVLSRPPRHMLSNNLSRFSQGL